MKSTSKPNRTASILAATVLIMLLTSLSSCTSMQSGQSFVAQSDGITYRFEVILSHHNYVRVAPVSGPEAVVGAITLPSTIRFEDHSYVVSQVAANAFEGYTGITSLTLPPTISVIEPSAFRNCQSLTSISVSTSISTIGDYAFYGCAQLQSFHFVNSISSLGQGCFAGCSSLSSLNLPSTITAIPDRSFCGCSSLPSLQLPATIMHIGPNAFAHCSGLQSIAMDRSVQQIGDSAFFDCDSVQSLSCLTPTPPLCGVATFGNMSTTIPVTVMMSSLASYQAAPGWNRFSNYVGTY